MTLPSPPITGEPFSPGDTLPAQTLDDINTNFGKCMDKIGGDTVTGAVSFTNSVTLSGPTYLPSVTSLAALRAIASPSDNSVVVLTDTSNSYFPDMSIAYRFDANDTLTKDFYQVSGASKLAYFAVKPTGIDNLHAGVWKPLNNSSYPKGPLFLSDPASSGCALGSSGTPLPLINLWTTTVPNGSASIANLNISPGANLSTDPVSAATNSYSLIPKAENYYEIDANFSAVYTWGTGVTDFYNAQSAVYGCLTCVNGTTGLVFPGGIASPSFQTLEWDTIMQGVTIASDYNSGVWTLKRLDQKFRIPTSKTAADLLQVFLSVSAGRSDLWVSTLVGGTLAATLNINVVSY